MATVPYVNSFDILRDYTFVVADHEKQLGDMFASKGKSDEAIACYSRSIALYPTAKAYTNRAVAYLLINRFQEVENDCTKVRKIDRSNVIALWLRAIARKELGKLKESVDDAELASIMEPSCTAIREMFNENKRLLKKVDGRKRVIEILNDRPKWSEV